MNLNNINTQWLETQLANEPIELMKLFDGLFEPRFSVAQMGITRQELLYWIKKNVLEPEESDEKRSWVRVNFFEYCWIRLVVQLRKINMPLESIAMLKDTISFMDEDTIKQLIYQGHNEVKNNPIADKVKKELPIDDVITHQLPLVIKIFKKYLTPFNLLVILLMIERRHLNLLVNYEGKYVLLAPECLAQTVLTNELVIFLNSPYVSVPIHSLLDEFYINPSIKVSVQKEIFNLTKQEAKVLELLRTEGIKEIRIRLANKSKGQIIIETVEEKPIAELEKQVQGLIKKGKFQNIRLYAEDGHLLLYEETNKMKV